MLVERLSQGLKCKSCSETTCKVFRGKSQTVGEVTWLENFQVEVRLGWKKREQEEVGALKEAFGWNLWDLTKKWSSKRKTDRKVRKIEAEVGFIFSSDSERKVLRIED